MFIRLVVAMLCGVLIGTERIMANKMAGVRTYALVSMGSALFVVISLMVTSAYMGTFDFDPLRVASQIVTGIGFLGAGLIIYHNEHLQGVTTAVGIWVSAGIGMAAGFGLYSIAILATLLTLFIYVIMFYFEQRVRKYNNKADQQ